jgi:mono/diheme cytochrome c family protein
MRHAILMAAALLVAGPAAAQNVNLGSEAQREAGRVLYQAKCAHCHGTTGAGDGPATAHLRPTPRDFTSSIFKFRTTASGELPTDNDIKRSIREGMPYTAMPPWPSLSEAEVTNLMYYIKTFADDFAGPFGEVTALDMPRAPSSSPESIARGREVYLENQCNDCHGAQGRGDGKSATTLEDQWEYHIRPADLTKRWTFRGGSAREDIYRTFTTGLDGSPMPSFDIQPPEDQWALVNYVASLSREQPEYGTTVVATPVAEISGEAFDATPVTFLAIVGQVIEPGRAFFPGVNAVEVRALVTDSEIAIRLAWNDLSPETRGSNGPGLPVTDGDWGAAPDTSGTFSDAVAIQFPTAMPTGTERPYFMFGDRKLSTDLWFADMAGPVARHYVGRGSANLTEEGPSVSVDADYADGRWTATFRRSRVVEGHIGFEEGTFVPISFSAWDGFNGESGNRRGLSAWYNLYVDVADKPSPALPMAGYGFMTLLLGVGVTMFMRRRYG